MTQTPRYFPGLCLLLAMTSPMRAQQQEPAPPPAPPTRPQAPAPPPLPPRPPEVLMPDEGNIAIGPIGWLPYGQPTFNPGHANTDATTGKVQFQGRSHISEGGDVTLPGGGHNAIRVTFLQTSASGNTTIPKDVTLWSTPFSAGDYLATHYRLRNVKLSYEYVTWPYPVGSRRIRLKTLWQVQYVSANSFFTAPLSATDTGVGSGTKNIILPTLGVGLTDYLSRNLRIDLNGSGFGIPGHSIIGDGEAAPAYKAGKIEIRGGVKLFYFKTSPAADYYMKGLLKGAFVGLRFYWR